MTRMKSYGKRLLAGLLLTLACTGIVYGCEGRIRVLRVGVFSGSYWDAPIGNSCAVIDAAIERFEAEHPGVQVEYTSGILKRDYSEWLIGRFLVGREPDIFMILPEDFGMLYGLGALEPLDQWIERDGEVSQKDFYFAALEGGRTKDIQYALPYECVPTLMFVNKSLLREEGIAVPESDWSWEQFYDICAAVTRDLDGDGKPDRFGSYGYTWRDALASNGIAVFSEDGAHSLLRIRRRRRPLPSRSAFRPYIRAAKSAHATLIRAASLFGRSCFQIIVPTSLTPGESNAIRALSGTASRCRPGRPAPTVRS